MVDGIAPSLATCNKYGITQEDYVQMFTMQDGKCWICQKPPASRRLAIDHKHGMEGRAGVRGLLCGSCNYGLGYFKDNAEQLLRASHYLRKGAIPFEATIDTTGKTREGMLATLDLSMTLEQQVVTAITYCPIKMDDLSHRLADFNSKPFRDMHELLCQMFRAGTIKFRNDHTVILTASAVTPPVTPFSTPR